MSTARHAQATDPFRNALRALVRRVTVKRASAVLWQIVDAARDVVSREVFYGVGICSLPPTSGKPEAILINVGGADAPVIIATRDEKTRAAVVPTDLKAGETVIYSEGVIVYLKKDGVEIRTPNGVAKSLATKDDVKALADFVNTLFVGGTGSAVIPANTVPRPAGTTILKGQ